MPSDTPRILHVSGDYPDPIEPAKTKAVRSLVELTRDDFAHTVFSLNRQSPPLSVLMRALPGRLRGLDLSLTTRKFDAGTAVQYMAPGRGIAHAAMLRKLGAALARMVDTAPLPDLIVGHKLSIEGIVVDEMSKLLGVPYALSIQGDTDTKVLAARPDLRSTFARIYSGAEVVFPFSPWSRRSIEGTLKIRHANAIDLPCATHIDQSLQPKVGSSQLVSVFHLKNARRKNLKAMVAAMRLVAKTHPDASLRVIGGGGQDDIAYCQQVIGSAANIELAGPADGSAVRQAMNEAVGFVLPSIRESFGMVFVEAVLSGTPIIYPRGTAVDGYFDNCPFALRVNAKSPAEIANAIRRLLDEEKALKASLAEWQTSAAGQRFSDKRIAMDFRDGMLAALRA